MNINGVAGPVRYANGANGVIRTGRDGDLVVELNGRHYENALAGRIFNAGAIVTAPVIFSTAAGTGGPILYNGSTTINAVLLKVGIGSSVVTTVAGTLGLCTGVSVALTSTTAVDYAAKNNFVGGALPLSSIFRVGTPAAAATNLIPLASFHTGALTVDTTNPGWFDIDGAIVCPPGTWVSLAGSATLSTLVVQTAFCWAEVPV